MMRRLLATLSVLAVAFALAARAADPIPPKIPVKSGPTNTEKLTPEQIALERTAALVQQADLLRQFEECREALQHLRNRYAESEDKEDRRKADALKEAQKLCEDRATELKFKKLIADLDKKDALANPDRLKDLQKSNKELLDDLKTLVKLLESADPERLLRERRIENERLLERIKELIAKQERVRAQTEQNRKDTDALKKAQENVTQQTRDLIGKDNKDNKGAETKKGEAKPEGKEGKDYGKAEAKYDTKENKGDPRSKDGGDPKEAKPSEGKEGKPAGQNPENKEGKPGDNKEGKPTEGKEGKPSESKEGKGRSEGRQTW